MPSYPKKADWKESPMPGGHGPDFSEELGRHRPALERSARRLCRDRYDADDLVQTTLARAWQSRTQFLPGGNIGGWLFRILSNHHRDNLRRRNGIQVPLPEELADDTRVNEEISSLLTLEPAIVLDALSRLPAELRAPLELLAVRGKRYREIAEQLSVPINTVGTRIRRARQLLQEIFARTTAAHRGGSQ
jgi:RNA polymerase sigma-70 factor (ECF subfamily)